MRKRFGLIGIEALVGLKIGKKLGACALVHLLKRISHPGAPCGPLLRIGRGLALTVDWVLKDSRLVEQFNLLGAFSDHSAGLR